MSQIKVLLLLACVVLVACGAETNFDGPLACVDPCAEDSQSDTCTDSVAFGTGYELGFEDSQAAAENIYAFLAERYREGYLEGFGDGQRVGASVCQ